jgi:hypothetical protein
MEPNVTKKRTKKRWLTLAAALGAVLATAIEAGALGRDARDLLRELSGEPPLDDQPRKLCGS